MRGNKLRQLATLQALAMTADTTDQYLCFLVKEQTLRAELEPFSDEEQFSIAKQTAQTIAEYEA